MLRNKSTKEMCGRRGGLVPVASGWSLWPARLKVSGRGLGTENRPLYGEMMQTLIPPSLGRTILGHFELSHASTTILGLVHLFIFYVFHLMKPKRRTLIVVFGL